MSKEENAPHVSIPLEYKRVEKILTLDSRVFEPCQAKEVVQWSWKHVRNEKWLVHLVEYTNEWHVKKITE